MHSLKGKENMWHTVNTLQPIFPLVSKEINFMYMAIINYIYIYLFVEFYRNL